MGTVDWKPTVPPKEIPPTVEPAGLKPPPVAPILPLFFVPVSKTRLSKLFLGNFIIRTYHMQTPL